MKSWLAPALLTLIFFGLWGFFPKITTRYIDPKSALVYEVAGGLLVGLSVLVWISFKPQVHPVGTPLGIITGVFGFVGALFFLYAVSRGKASVVVTLSALYPLIVILLSRLFLDEPITTKQGIGIVLALISMVLFVI
jgi:transporter family protein